MRSTSGVQILEGVFECERRFCWSSDRLRTRDSQLANRCCCFFSTFCPVLLSDAVPCLESTFSNLQTRAFSLFSSLLISFHFHCLYFSINFRWNLMNVWNLFCLEKRTLYDIWNLINKFKLLLRWCKNEISCYIIKMKQKWDLLLYY